MEKTELEALGIDALRSEARKTVGGGSWVVKASKSQLVEYITRRFGPTDIEKAELFEVGAKSASTPTSSSNPVGAVEVPPPSETYSGPSVSDITTAIATALSGLGKTVKVDRATIEDVFTTSAKVEELVKGYASTALTPRINQIASNALAAQNDVNANAVTIKIVTEAVTSRIDKVEELVKNLGGSRDVKIIVPEKPVYNAGTVHQEFDKLVRLLSLNLNVYLAGPAGSGKTESAHKAADALGLAFYPTSVSQQTSKSDIFGYINPGTGVLVRTPFRNAYENGGVFLLDEIDAGNPNVLVSINSAISNGGASFPDGYVKRHANFRATAAANTWGYGADRQYVGRNQLDAATLSRFAQLAWDYDEVFERAITSNQKWTSHVQALRHSAFALKERLVISPRASINGAIALAGGFTWAETEKLFIFGGVSPDVEAKVRKGAVK
jgi:hypothetical protein